MKKYILLLSLVFLISCYGGSKNQKHIIIFHAGSLSVPLKQMEHRFEELNPGVDILLEGAGSVACARKITDLGRECDIMASADYRVIDEMLIPGYTDINLHFAGNSMVIAFTENSLRAGEINSANWTSVLLDNDVIYGRSDPDSDPCGYRSVLTMQLAEKYYGIEGFTENLTAKDRNMIRPKEVDLLALLQTGVIDYFFTYRSVAIQHKLEYIELPSEINLSDPLMNEYYSLASIDIKGKSPDEYIHLQGESIKYGITLLRKAPSRNEALMFLDFFFGPEGQEIIKSNGQDLISVPAGELEKTLHREAE